jgi:CRP/FNR family cyclic AMP-dependent transcriptional regulator
MDNPFHDKTALVEALEKQKIVAGNRSLAEGIASVGETLNIAQGITIIHQGGDDNEVYLIVAGSFHIVVNGQTLARRVATDHVGEMAAILPVQRRAASVVAHEDSVVVRLSNSQVEDLGEQYPQIWRSFARELAHRVEQRNKIATAASQKIRLFLMTSKAASEAALAIEKACADQFTIVTWKEGGLQGANYSIASLEHVLDQSDVAIAIAEPSVEGLHGRDDIIFELGFFMGRLGRHRTFLIEPRGEKMELPPELAGVNTLTYPHHPGGDLTEALAPVCAKLTRLIAELGPNR